MADVYASLKLGFETGDFNRFSRAIEDSVSKGLTKGAGMVSRAGGAVAQGAAIGLGLQLGNKLLSNISRAVTDFPLVVSIMKLLRLILMIGLLPLIPLLKPVVEGMAKFAAWLLENPVAQHLLTIIELLGFMWAFMKAGELLKGLAGVGGIAGAGAAGVGGAATTGMLAGLLPQIVALVGAAYGTEYIAGKLKETTGVATPGERAFQGPGFMDFINTITAPAASLIENILAIFKGGAKSPTMAAKEFGGEIINITEQSEKASEAISQMAESGFKAKDIWNIMMKDLTSQWARTQLAFQSFAQIAASARGWSAGYFYGMTPAMSASASSQLTPGGFGTATKAYDPSRYSAPKYSGGAFGSGGTGGLGGIAGRGGRQIGGVIGEEGSYYLHRGERVKSATESDRGSMGGPTININVNSPSIRADSDIKELVRNISREIQVALRGRVGYGPRG